jgi:putative FmdB family regulatory protein
MPIYEFNCREDNLTLEKIRRLGDENPPNCPICNRLMDRVFSTPIVINKEAVPGKLKKRSEDQGKKFFHRHPDKQDLVKQTLNSKP